MYVIGCDHRGVGKKAEQTQKKYKALSNERQILINEIAKLKAKVNNSS